MIFATDTVSWPSEHTTKDNATKKLCPSFLGMHGRFLEIILDMA